MPAAAANAAVEAADSVRAGVAGGQGDPHGAVAADVAVQIDDAAVVNDVAIGDRDAVAIGAVAIAFGGDDKDAPGAVKGGTRGRFGCQRGNANNGQGTGPDKLADHE